MIHRYLTRRSNRNIIRSCLKKTFNSLNVHYAIRKGEISQEQVNEVIKNMQCYAHGQISCLSDACNKTRHALGLGSPAIPKNNSSLPLVCLMCPAFPLAQLVASLPKS